MLPCMLKGKGFCSYDEGLRSVDFGVLKREILLVELT